MCTVAARREHSGDGLPYPSDGRIGSGHCPHFLSRSSRCEVRADDEDDVLRPIISQALAKINMYSSGGGRNAMGGKPYRPCRKQLR